MTRKDLRIALARLGWPVPDFAEYIGKNRSTVWRWLKGDTPIDVCAERVLELVLERGTVPQDSRKRRAKQTALS